MTSSKRLMSRSYDNVVLSDNKKGLRTRQSALRETDGPFVSARLPEPLPAPNPGGVLGRVGRGGRQAGEQATFGTVALFLL